MATQNQIIRICRAQDGEIFEIETTLQKSVGDIGSKIEEKTQIPKNDQILLLINGTTLNSPNHSLSDYGFSLDDFIFVLNKKLLDSNAGVPSEQIMTPPEMREPEIPPLQQSENEDPLLLKIRRQQHTFKRDLQLVENLRVVTVSRLAICNDYARKMENQENTLRAADASLQYQFSKTFRFWSEFWNTYSTVQKKHQQQLQEFPTSIDKLKEVKLHEALCDSNKKNLIDLVDEERIKKWAKDCSARHEKLKSKVDELDQIMKSVQENFTRKTSEIDFSKIASLIKEGSEYVEALSSKKTKFSNDLKKITDTIESATRGSLNWDICSDYEELLNDHKRQLESLKNIDNRMQSCVLYMSNLKLEVSKSLHKRLQDVGVMQVKLDSVATSIPLLREDNEEQETKLFPYLTVVKKMPDTYEACLKEISRRRAFQKMLLSHLDKINENLKTMKISEYRKRKKFLEKWRSMIPRNLPNLDKYPPNLEVTFSESIDENLPEIDLGGVETETFFIDEIRTRNGTS